MSSSVPPTDPRRTVALRAFLQRIAPALAPRWAGPAEDGTFGNAMVEIAARLGEQTTRRLDQTPSRDTIAFFDELDIAPTPPRAADGTVVFALGEGRETPVFAPARVQIAATVNDEEVTFETQQALSLAPGRLADVIAVDPATDRIERAPSRVMSIEPPPAAQPHYSVLSFANAGSEVLQLTSEIGLAEHDMLRIGDSAHRIGKPQDGLVPLLDPLTTAAPAGTAVAKLDALEAFNMRDVQRHRFDIGHAELLNLEQPAKISLQFSPDGLARLLSGLDVTYYLWGTLDGEDEPGWHELGQLGASGSILVLFKSWRGSVDELEIDGKKSRWLRAELQRSVEARASLGVRLSTLALGVESMVEEGGEDEAAEGSDTIAQAFHNGEPLSVASRFFPFGPEPLRFDSFALAAPEALSKKAARVTLDVRMVDASLTSLEIAVAAGPIRAYGIGENGHLQALAFEAGGELRWQELDPPVLPDDRGSIDLEGSRGLHPVGVAFTLVDIVVAEDAAGGLWSGTITVANEPSASFGKPEWAQLPPLASAAGGYARLAVAPNTNPPAAPAVGALLFLPTKAGVQALRLNTAGVQAGEWQLLTSSGDTPSIDDTCQLVVVQGPSWPARPASSEVEILLVDSDGSVYLGFISPLPAPVAMTVRWHLLDDAKKAALDVRPVATYFDHGTETPGLWVAWALADNHHLQGWRRLGGDGSAVDGPPNDNQAVAVGTALHADPQTLGVDGKRPVTVALSGTPKARTALLWAGDAEVRVADLPVGETTAQIYLVTPAAGPPPDLVVGAAGEKLLFGEVGNHTTVRVELHDGVVLESPRPAHFIEVFAPAPADVHDLGRAKITNGSTRTYLLDKDVQLDDGQRYRLMKRVRRRAVDLRGAVDTGALDHLILAANDSYTKRGHRVLIRGKSYLVREVDAGVATLDLGVVRPPTAASTNGDTQVEVRYTPVIDMGTNTVTTADLGTLALVTGDGASPEITGLQFGGTTEPKRQPIPDQGERVAGGAWVRLGLGWTVRPPASGLARLIGDLRVAGWVAHTLERGYQNPELSWEYFDGDGWRRLEQAFFDGTDNLATSGHVTFKVPHNLATTDIGGKDDYWIRARLIGGDYGRPEYVVTTIQDGATKSTQTVTVDTSKLRPPEIFSIEASFVLDECVPPEIVLVTNNLATLDQTQASAVSEAKFDLFEGALAIDPDAPQRALYLGFTLPIAVNPLDIYANVEDQQGDGMIQADVFTPAGWRHITVEDETGGLRRRGMIRLFLNRDAVRARKFGAERFWIRLRPDSEGDDWAPVVNGLYPNAALARQARTIEQEIIGSSLGEPHMALQLSETPMLPQSLELRVRERLSDEERTELEAEHRRSSGRSELLDDTKAITRFAGAPGTWVLWRRVESFVGQGGGARIYRLDPATGTVGFGDGRAGKIPPAGSDAVRAFQYQQGGGRQGNITAWTELQTRSALEAVDTVVLPIDAAGGIDAPGPDDLFSTAPERLRHAGQALTTADFEALAVASSPDIVRARCFGPVGSQDAIRVVIAARNGSRCPIPALAQRDAIARYLAEAGWGPLGDRSIEVTGPIYVQLKVEVDLVSVPDRAAEVEEAATRLLTEFLHPIDGGPDGTGWPFGRRPWPSDVLRALSTIDEIDRVEAVELRSVEAGTSLDMLPPDGLVCAEADAIDVRVTPGDRS